ncbi:hypothetical protein FO519_003995 [Halicephalobus sp. NKZ332]|nr:hypothetical protein FO519_003995 [Halicephalobus sp. NKZ332]
MTYNEAREEYYIDFSKPSPIEWPTPTTFLGIYVTVCCIGCLLCNAYVGLTLYKRKKAMIDASYQQEKVYFFFMLYVFATQVLNCSTLWILTYASEDTAQFIMNYQFIIIGLENLLPAWALNRFTAVLMPVHYKSLWDGKIKWIMAFIIIFPYVCFWYFPFRQVTMTYNEAREEYYIDFSKPSPIEWPISTGFLGTCVTVCCIACLLCNAYVGFILHKRRKIISDSSYQQEKVYFFFMLYVFATQVLNCSTLWILTYANESVSQLIITYQFIITALENLLPAWAVILGLFWQLTFHTTMVTNLLDLILSLNRFTAVLLPVHYKSLWDGKVKWVVAFITIFPYVCFWYFPFRQVTMTYNEAREEYYVDFSKPSPIEWPISTGFLGTCVTVCCIACLLCNAYVGFTLRKRRKTVSDSNYQQEKVYFFFMLCVFATQLLNCCALWMLTYANESMSQLIITYQFVIIALENLFPAWAFFLMNSALRNATLEILFRNSQQTSFTNTIVLSTAVMNQ